MSKIKNMIEKMSDEGLYSYIVTYVPFEETEELEAQFWAEDAAHAGEQCDDAYPFCAITLISRE